MTSVLVGCGKKGHLFGDEITVITACDFYVEGVVHTNHEITYGSSGIPKQGTVKTELLYEDAETVPDKTWTLDYEKEKGEIRTYGLFTIEDETTMQTLLYDKAGRLLSWQIPQMPVPYTYTYDTEGRLQQITGDGFNETFEQTESGYAIYLTIPNFAEIQTQVSRQAERIQGLTQKMTTSDGQETITQRANHYTMHKDKPRLENTLFADTQWSDDRHVAYYYENEENPAPVSVAFDAMPGEEETAGQWTIAYSYEGDRLVQESRSGINDAGETISATLNYEYDKQGHLTGLKEQVGKVSIQYTFQQIVVSDPVVRSFLLTKPAVLNGAYYTGKNGNDSLFVLTQELDVYQGLTEHFCYRCGRFMPEFEEICPYCETPVNILTDFLSDIWTLDGSLLK